MIETVQCPKRWNLQLLLILLVMLCTSPSYGVNPDSHPNFQKVINRLVANGTYSTQQARRVIASATFQQQVLDAMTSPAEYRLTWGKYRDIFMDAARIEQGVEFWKAHATELARAEREYGVSPEIIVAIIGVESKYGTYKGRYKVVDSLATLVHSFPRRSNFFADELFHFLTLAKTNDLDINEIKGSYAGAMGYPQFIASSYRNYAVDFTNDGKVDLIGNSTDAIGSVANYFKRHGWQRNRPVVTTLQSNVPESIKRIANRKRKAIYEASYLRSLGANIDPRLVDSQKLNVIQLDVSKRRIEKASGIYIVRAGDSLCKIAERAKMRCSRLARLNNIKDKNKIYRGQRLKLSKSASKSLSTSEPAAQQQEQLRYAFAYPNFYVITKYNHSVLYAMAVYELSQAIKSARYKR